MGLLSNIKVYAIGAALAVALIGLAIWRAYAKGEAAEKADIAIAGLNKAIEANNARRAIEVTPVDVSRDPYNRDR